MKRSAPKQITWIIALALAILSLLGYTGTLAAFSQYAFWLALASAALLLIATVTRGL